MWEKYYNELDPLKRVRIYAENIGAALPDKKRSAVWNMRQMEPATEEDALRKELFLVRHVGPKGQDMDRVMAAILEYIHFGRDRSRSAVPEIRKILQGLGFDVAQGKGEAAEALLDLELRNGAMRYLSCCQGANYGRTFFGLVAASEERQNDKTTEEIWLATRGVERLVGRSLTEEEQAHLQRYEAAVTSAFYQFHEDAREWFENYERVH